MNNSHYLALLSMIFAGLTGVFSKLGLKNISADIALVIRTSLVFLFIAVNAFAINNVKDIVQISKKDFFFLTCSAVTTSLSWIFYHRAIKIGNLSDVALIDKGSIIVTLILSYFILNEEFSAKTIIGGLLIISGLIVMIIK